MFGRQWRWNTRHITPLLVTPILSAALWPAGVAVAAPPPERPARPGSPDWFRNEPARGPTQSQFASGPSGPIDLTAGGASASPAPAAPQTPAPDSGACGCGRHRRPRQPRRPRRQRPRDRTARRRGARRGCE